jgi:hypothetical protein
LGGLVRADGIRSEKLGVQDRTQAVTKAIERGILHVD